MMFARIRRAGAFVGLVAAMGLAAPAGVSAAVPGQPTALTVTPEFSATTARGDAGVTASGIQVAQRGGTGREEARRKLRRSSVEGRRETSRVARRPNNTRRVVVQPRRTTVVRRPSTRVVRYYNGQRHYYGGRWYRYNDGYWYNDGGAVVAAGLIGLVAGAAIAGSAAYNNNTVVVDDGYPSPYSSSWYSYCANKYNSFRSSDGTYLGYDGLRHVCRIP